MQGKPKPMLSGKSGKTAPMKKMGKMPAPAAPGLSPTARKRQSMPVKSNAGGAVRGQARAAMVKKPKPVSTPVPIGGVKKPAIKAPARKSVPAKNTGGAEKASWGGWSPPRKVVASKKTAAGVQRRSQQGRRG